MLERESNTRRVVADSEIFLEYTLSTEHEVLESTEGSDPFRLKLGSGILFPAVESALLGLAEGESVEKILDSSICFGAPDPKLKISLAKNKLPEKIWALELGASFEAPGPDKKPKRFRVISKTDDQLTIDGNHPLAGVALEIKAKILKIF